MEKIIVISGATASGKTKFAVDFCKKNKGEIISSDSRQVYKYLNIGSNKEGFLSDGCRIIDGIKQYLTDIIEPDCKYSAADFAKDANAKIKEIIKAGKLPVISGGTGLYIKALLYGLDEMPPADSSLREVLSKKTAAQLYEELLKLDGESALKHKDNPQRLLRALEINILSGKTVTSHFKPRVKRYDFKHYFLNADRARLYERINKRCLAMIENGLIEETREVLQMGFSEECPAFNSIGYKQVLQFLKCEISKDDLIKELCAKTRQYAKRQFTWFRGQTDIEKINV
ncbi:MAG: tRNA (adenosine(37)-N6)-dimethylallyltransferase MiaA [Elusimicrobiota bacterium]|jgi:tRNA dimethylallyltransferase|nr:tRNA (adenosine(37)-N6)-dimethylallyltransferase MiaA [Elusimicrobiota bacterium]